MVPGIPPVENDRLRLDFFSDWILLVHLLIVSRVDLIVFVLFLEAVGVRGYCCMAVGRGNFLLSEHAVGNVSHYLTRHRFRVAFGFT